MQIPIMQYIVSDIFSEHPFLQEVKGTKSVWGAEKKRAILFPSKDLAYQQIADLMRENPYPFLLSVVIALPEDLA